MPASAAPLRSRTSLPPLDPARYQPSAARPVRAKSRRLAADTEVQPHSHAWGQLAFSVTGVVRLTAERSTYLVPPSRAVWVPPHTEHTITVVEDAELRTLYLHQADGQCGPDSGAAAAGSAWRHCRVIEVSNLLRELALQLMEESAAAGASAVSAREPLLSALVVDELRRARPVPLGVALPRDKRLLALCQAVLEDPVRWTTLEGWAHSAGASARTVARLFRSELGTTFVQWRQQVLLARALSMAARKLPMSVISAELGYASPSAFSAMVRRSVGAPPSRFFS